MVYTNFPVTVDGQLLNTYAWNIDVKTRPIAAFRSADVAITGIDGVAASVLDDIEPTSLTFSMWALGTDANGLVTADALSQCRANIDTLSTIFGRSHQLMDVRETINLSGGVRQWFCKRAESFSPEIRAGGLARFTISLVVPSGLSQDVGTSDWTQAAVTTGNTYEVTTLRGSTAPIADPVLTFTGPVTNPTLTDLTTGGYVRYNGTLAAGSVWRVNAGTWSSRTGALTLGSADTAGTDVLSVTDYGGGKAPLLRFVPTISSGESRIMLRVGGSGFTAATSVAVRGQRRFWQ